MHTNRGLKLAMEDLGGGALLKKKSISLRVALKFYVLTPLSDNVMWQTSLLLVLPCLVLHNEFYPPLEL